MQDNLKIYLEKLKSIEIGHHYIALESYRLNSIFEEIYEEGKEEFREYVIALLDSLLKDETLKILLIREISNLNKTEW